MKNGRASKKSARMRSTGATTQQAEVAAHRWNVNYLKECEEQTRDLRDKAYFLGLNKLASLLESVRTESKAVLTMLVMGQSCQRREDTIAAFGTLAPSSLLG